MGKKNNILTLMPAYMKDFHCIGGECEYTCCAGWSIKIDKKTFTKYKNSKNPEFQEKVKKYIRRNRSITDSSYASFILDDNGNCPFLNDDKLCWIQANIGGESLCTTCKMYPRLVTQIHPEIYELSCSTSCPAAIRLAMFNKEPMVFESSDGISALLKDFLVMATPISNSQKGSPYFQDAFLVRNTCIDIMQERSNTIAERIFLIGMMLKRLDEIIAPTHEDISSILASYIALSKSGEFAGTLSEFATSEDARKTMGYNIFDSLFLSNTAISRRFFLPFADDLAEYKQSVLSALIKNKLDKVELAEENSVSDEVKQKLVDIFSNIHTLVEKRSGKVFAAFAKKDAHVLENFFVNYIFSTAFPFKYKNKSENLSLYQHFIILAELYSLFRMILCNLFEKYEDISPEIIIELIVGLTTYSQHSINSQKIVQIYQATGFDSLAHMSFLLKC